MLRWVSSTANMSFILKTSIEDKFAFNNGWIIVRRLREFPIIGMLGNLFSCFSADPNTKTIISCVCCVAVICITVVAVGVGVGLHREDDGVSSTTAVSTVMVRTSATAMVIG
ncbi:unnamed protein product [Adineta ricciae]|uniref:Transmembrane protein n=1 Tax=Adineta ricciae TaxID=249248 RepID=A0A813QVD3_ADIRI|nr:unnamed protein product [Adineta ricciae]